MARCVGLPVLADAASSLETLELKSVQENLTDETSFITAEYVKGGGFFDPRASLGNHDFDAIVMRRLSGVFDEREIEDVIFDAGEAIEPEVSIDHLLDDLALEFGTGLEVEEKGGGEAIVGLGFVFLQDQALAGEVVLAGVHAGALLALDGFRAG